MAATALATASCEATTFGGHTKATSVTLTVGPSGGRLELSDSSVVTIPAGALATLVSLTFSVAPAQFPSSSPITATSVYSVAPLAQAFQTPITIGLPGSGTVWTVGDAGEWKAIGTRRAGPLSAAEVTHGGYFVLTGAPPGSGGDAVLDGGDDGRGGGSAGADAGPGASGLGTVCVPGSGSIDCAGFAASTCIAPPGTLDTSFSRKPGFGQCTVTPCTPEACGSNQRCCDCSGVPAATAPVIHGWGQSCLPNGFATQVENLGCTCAPNP